MIPASLASLEEAQVAVVDDGCSLPAMREDALDKVRNLEALVLQAPQVPAVTHHLIHGGLYARTLRMPAGTVLTGALIKLATVLIVNGECTVYTGGDAPLQLKGYHVLPASAGRKQAFLARADTDLTMLFATQTKTVEEAEAEFTDEADLLFSRQHADRNTVLITGE